MQDIEWGDDDRLTFQVDTDGETRPVLRVNDDKLGGYFLLGNTRYPVSGQSWKRCPRARRRWSRIRTSRKPARR